MIRILVFKLGGSPFSEPPVSVRLHMLRRDGRVMSGQGLGFRVQKRKGFPASHHDPARHAFDSVVDCVSHPRDHLRRSTLKRGQLNLERSKPTSRNEKGTVERRLNHVVGPNTCRGDITDLSVFVGIPSILKNCSSRFNQCSSRFNLTLV